MLRADRPKDRIRIIEKIRSAQNERDSAVIFNTLKDTGTKSFPFVLEDLKSKNFHNQR